MAKDKETSGLTAIDVVMRSEGRGRPAAAASIANVDAEGRERIVEAYESKSQVRTVIQTERINATKPRTPLGERIKREATATKEAKAKTDDK